ncbi:MAG TPA: TIGR03960 family B12-binding radical SAM protein [Polyangiaceae bacterium]|nr:TIGR03960 family B12-binding radical SAM protein [Polyangiaceae bacterium]
MPSFATHPYASFIQEIEKPARYVGGEWGQVRKPWDRTRVRICLAFPDIFDIGMSHLGTRILYAELNEAPDMLCERAFCPWTDMERALRERGLPLLSLENAKPLSAFHVVGISLQHELVYTNVLTLLDLGGIALRSSERADSDPLVLGGGSVASHPEPVADFFDAFVIGDGEKKAAEVARRWVEDLERGVGREERLRHLASLGGVYVPSLYEHRFDARCGREVVDRPRYSEAPLPVVRATVPELGMFPTRFPTGGPEAVFDRLSIEIARGCSQGCRFCQGGMIFRPERERDPATIVECVLQSLAHSGQDEISLTSLSPADYTAMAPLVAQLSHHPSLSHVALNVSSLRAYGLDDPTLDEIRRVRVSNLTFAPEAGTQRLREVINKNVTEEQLLETVRRVVRRGWERIKLYFMIGLPTETQEDVEAIVRLTSRVRAEARAARESKGRSVQVTASASTFVPKPHTPFQWASMVDLDTVKEKHRRIVVWAREHKVDIKMHEPHGSVLEGLLSRGDRRLGPVIEDAWRAGSRFDGWEGNVKWGIWLAAMERHDLQLIDYIKEIPNEATTPWSHIHVGVSEEFLRQEWEKAQRFKHTLPCLRPADPASKSDKLVCYHCGLDCDLEQAARIRSQRMSAPVADRAPAAMVASCDTVQYRFCYEKIGRASLLGHLDMVREMPRIMRRAGFAVVYTQGFHPKAMMGFGPALRLGVPSFEEYVDVKMQELANPEEGLAKLNAICPEGIRFVRMVRLPDKAPSLVQAIGEARMLLGIDPSAVEARGGVSWLKERLGELMSSESLPWIRNHKGKERTLDLRPWILELRMGTEDDAVRMSEAGIPGSWVMVRLHHALTAQGSVRIDEVVALMGEREALPYRAVRVALTKTGGRSVMPSAEALGVEVL